MNPYVEIVARARAHQERRAKPLRRIFQLTEDPKAPNAPFGIATIRVVSEEHIQAVAFGPLNRNPEIIARVNPLDRRSVDLEPFAYAIVDYFERMLAEKRLPRFWVPHEAALESLDIFAYRYATNQEASDILRQAAWICRMLVEEARYDGQQVVAVGNRLLMSTVATGHSPAKDVHIGAILPWIYPDPEADFDPSLEADRVAIDQPASAVLARAVDDHVEDLRSELKRLRGDDAEAHRKEIEALLTQEIYREWGWLLVGRSAYWRLALDPMPDDSPLVAASLDRLCFPARSGTVAAMSRMLDRYEDAIQLTKAEEVDRDRFLRRLASNSGRVFEAVIVGIDKPEGPNRNPCILTVRTTQQVLRVRRGTKLRVRDAKIEGRVEELHSDRTSGGTLIRIKSGIKQTASLVVGDRLEWVDAVPFMAAPSRRKTYKALAKAKLDPRAPLTVAPIHLPHDDLLALSEALKTGGAV